MKSLFYIVRLNMYDIYIIQISISILACSNTMLFVVFGRVDQLSILLKISQLIPLKSFYMFIPFSLPDKCIIHIKRKYKIGFQHRIGNMNHDKQSKGGIIEKLFPGKNQICVAFLKGLPVIQLSFFFICK